MTETQRAELPVACTLGAADLRARGQQWHALLDRAGLDRQRSAQQLVLRFRRGDDVANELRALVLAERECCAFLDWDLEVDGDQLVLRVSGEVGAIADAFVAGS